MIRLAHLSDLHATPVRITAATDLASKRFWGWLSWIARRRHIYRPAVLEALLEDLRAQAPDHVAITGDLTNIALPDEFPAARAWLERIGGADRVSVVPGNHDAYVSVPPEISWDLWNEWMASDDAAGGRAEFPTLRVRGGLAVIGICTAQPTRPFQASGSVGAAQLERLEKRLSELADSSLCRVVLIHHPITRGAVSRRRALTDAGALREVLSRCDADLVLHGHAHRTLAGGISGPRGPIPVIGVRSSSYVGESDHKRAQYHIYEIEPGPDRFRITTRARSYHPATHRFTAEDGAASPG